MFIRRMDAETEAPILWPPDADPLEKTLMLGKTEGRRRTPGAGEMPTGRAALVQANLL